MSIIIEIKRVDDFKIETHKYSTRLETTKTTFAFRDVENQSIVLASMIRSRELQDGIAKKLRSKRS